MPMQTALSHPYTDACAQMLIEPPAQAVLQAGQSPGQAVRCLLDAGHDMAALQLAARLMPKRYVVAWLCQCARDQALEPEARAGMALAERWLREPAESNRRAAFEYANAGGYATLGAWFAATAGWAEGSLAPLGQEATIVPPDHLTARAAVAAFNLLALRDAAAFHERRKGYVQQCLALLDGLAQH